MVRPIGILAGLGFIAALLWSVVTTPLTKDHNKVYDFFKHPRPAQLVSDGPLGRFDEVQVQRGFQVYKEVCSACHSLKHVAFRNLADLGYTENEVKAIAAAWAETPSINPETGEPATRKSTPADHFPSPYANEVAARAANNGAAPPDLSLITKAREDGVDYVYSLLTGYQAPPANLPRELQPSGVLHYNPYFPNLNLAMAAPLTGEGQVTYADGTKATVDQMARDVTAFLVWTAEPKLEARHQAGWATILFLLMATTLAYLAYRNIWAGVKH